MASLAGASHGRAGGTQIGRAGGWSSPPGHRNGPGGPYAAFGPAAAAPHPGTPLPRIADDQGDVPLGTALVPGVAAVGRDHPGPQLGLLLAGCLAGPYRPPLAVHGQLRVRAR